ncbi:MAG: hypothetical protein MZW92_12020 [Comamonadaceae bacterium]|nr:hypothetical protein [Comamonadaceae bacterium]
MKATIIPQKKAAQGDAARGAGAAAGHAQARQGSRLAVTREPAPPPPSTSRS